MEVSLPTSFGLPNNIDISEEEAKVWNSHKFLIQ